jgi:glucuronosyltransferase
VAFDLAEVLEKICRVYHEHPEVRALLDESFDLVMMNAFLGECSYALMAHFQTRTMIITSMPTPFWISTSFGLPTLPSINPILFYGYSDQMNFLQRIHNFLGTVYIYCLRNYKHNPKMSEIYREYLPNAATINEIEKNASLILINSYPSMNIPRLLLPGMIEIGGMHCRKPKPLPHVSKNLYKTSIFC